MTDRDEDILYNLEEEDTATDDVCRCDKAPDSPELRADNDKSRVFSEDEMPYAYGHGVNEDDDDHDDDDEESSEGENDGDGKKKQGKRGDDKSAWRLLFSVMIGPTTGWKALKQSRLSPAAFATQCFVPLAALAGLSEFLTLFFTIDTGVTSAVTNCIVVFLSYFFSYFLVPLLGRPFTDAKVTAALQTPFGKKSVETALSTLSLFKILSNLIPGLEPVIVFLPLWTIYIIYKLVPMLRAPKDKRAMTTVVLCILILGLPMGWDWLLGLMLP